MADLIAAGMERLHASGHYEERSPIDSAYNCIAFAAGDTARFWSPIASGGYFWPADGPAEDTVDGVMAALASAGYVECEDASFEDGHEKVAVFAVGDQPTHAARQDTDLRVWLSKLGKEYDIAHTNLADVGGREYGEPVKHLRRERTSAPELPLMRPSESSDT